MKRTIDWAKLGFNYLDTDSHIRYVWRDGRWGKGELVHEPFINVHIAATALHYGQTAFEGLKAFGCRDGKVRLFRPEANARRLATSARRICMPKVPETMFLEAVQEVVRANVNYVPPYGMNGALYVRPLLFGSGPKIGLKPADEYVFLVLALPVGAYYKGGLTPVRAIVLDDYDRAAPLGVGHVKVGGNYAVGLGAHEAADAQGFAVELYLDAKEHRYIEEFGTSNFVGVTREGAYLTPDSASILPSITNLGLQELARHQGLPVEIRPVLFTELAELAEAAACGTAVVITPVNEIVRGGQTIRIGPREGCGPVLTRLYQEYTAIQCGEAPDVFGWTVEV